MRLLLEQPSSQRVKQLPVLHALSLMGLFWVSLSYTTWLHHVLSVVEAARFHFH